MKATISWWDLSESSQTIDTLREYLRDEGVEPWMQIHGMRLKFWISDRATNCWGAVMLWESSADLTTPMPPNRATELIGYPPTERMSTEVEAIVEGIHSGQLVGHGLAFEVTEKVPANVKVASEFSAPPADPIELVRSWFDNARANNVREPGALSLATANAQSQVSNRIVQILDIRDTGLVFTTHSHSPKGRQMAQTNWVSGVLYWREIGRQLIVSGPTQLLSNTDSDALWAARPVGAHPMSVVSKQSEPLQSEDELRARAEQLARTGQALQRPQAWAGYLLEPALIEFWQAAPDRLHQRLRYERSGPGWRIERLQP